MKIDDDVTLLAHSVITKDDYDKLTTELRRVTEKELPEEDDIVLGMAAGANAVLKFLSVEKDGEGYGQPFSEFLKLEYSRMLTSIAVISLIADRFGEKAVDEFLRAKGA